MKINIVHTIVFCTLLLQVCGCSGSKISDYERLNLKGKVRKVITKHDYKEIVENGSIRKEETKVMNSYPLPKVAMFDKFGYLEQEEDKYYNNGFPITTYKYKGNKKVKEVCFFVGNAIPQAIIEYKYDAKGRLSRQTITQLEEVRQYDHIYGKENRLEKMAITINNNPAKHMIFYYNSAGYTAKEEVFDTHGNIESRKEYAYEYDTIGNWVKRRSSEGSITEREIDYY